jgi:hypothetical protein
VDTPPTFTIRYSAPAGRLLLYARALPPGSVAIGRWLLPHSAIVSLPRTERLFPTPIAKGWVSDDFHPIPIGWQDVDPVGASDRAFLRNRVPAQACGPGVVMECRPAPLVLQASDWLLLLVASLLDRPQAQRGLHLSLRVPYLLSVFPFGQYRMAPRGAPQAGSSTRSSRGSRFARNGT